MAKVFVNAGHGGSDPGAVANGFKEKDLNLAIAQACQAELERHGVDVFMCRTGDTFQTLQEDIDDCNVFNPDLALDIHNNAGGGDGAEVFYSVVGGTGKVLAQNILDEIVAIGQNSRGIKTKINSQGRDWFGIIRETYAPTVLVECAFVDTKADLAIVDTAAEQKAMGVAIAKGVLKTLGIDWKPVEAPKPTNKLYRVQVGAYAIRENAEAMLEKLKAAGFKDAFIKET